MRAEGVMLALLDIPAWCTEDYNRWYDLDHMPEHVAKDDVLMGRRYVAQRPLHASPRLLTSEALGGYPPYLTTYWFGGPTEFTGDEALAGWRDLDRSIVKAGRYWREGVARHTSRWRLQGATARPSSHIRDVALPYVAHRGVVFALGSAAAPDRVEEALAWWDEVHLPDLLTAPGIIGAVTLAPVDPAMTGAVAHLLLCEHHPGAVMQEIDDVLRYASCIGRYPAHGGAYQPQALLPYETILPLQYDFDL